MMILQTIKAVAIKNMQNKIIGKPIIWGLASSVLMLSIYFTVVSLISGGNFAVSQFNQNWYFLVSLAIGFGIQIGLYTYLKELVKNHTTASLGTGKTVAITGTTSTLSMISCCAHYLINILPILGVSGVLGFIGQYQKGLFEVGLLFNLFGIAYISKQIISLKKQI